MIDKTHDEQAALVAGGNAGGEYLDSIGITDLVTLTVEQYQQYVECVVGGYIEHLEKVVKLFLLAMAWLGPMAVATFFVLLSTRYCS